MKTVNKELLTVKKKRLLHTKTVFKLNKSRCCFWSQVSQYSVYSYTKCVCLFP
jgi:hypothetical protein